ncbi:MAG: hypothetical protein LiPW39_377, partial [Parcubacteria group bacterium LiPW_39]
HKTGPCLHERYWHGQALRIKNLGHLQFFGENKLHKPLINADP